MPIHALFGFVAAVLVASIAAGEPYGSLSAKFQVTGELHTPKKLDINKDQQYCGKHVLVDETVVVGEEGGLANVVVYLVPDIGEKVPDNPELKEKLPAEVALDMANCRFSPHIVVLTTDQKLAITNRDRVGHNARLDVFNNPPLGTLHPVGSTVAHSFGKAERLPAMIGCNIHPWMRAYLVVRDNPYTGVSDEKGQLKIEGIPAGKWSFTVWHETGYVKGQRKGEDLGWKRGKVAVEIKADEETNLGTIEVPASTLWK